MKKAKIGFWARHRTQGEIGIVMRNMNRRWTIVNPWNGQLHNVMAGGEYLKGGQATDSEMSAAESKFFGMNIEPYLATKATVGDPVNRPSHYTAHPSGVECIAITEHMNFNLGNAMKYIWRAGLKSDDPTEDLKKAEWHLRREISRLGKVADADTQHPTN